MRVKVSLIVIFALLMFVPRVEAATKKQSLDGTKISGDVKHPDETKPDPDTLIFKDGKFHSTACDEYGFGDGSYSTAARGDAVTFDAVTKNKDGNSIVWHGIVSGDKATATGLWSDSHGKTDTFAFTGTVTK